MKWHVSKEASVSDHSWSIYTLKCVDIETTTYRNSRLTDWALYNEELEDRLGTFVQSITTKYIWIDRRHRDDFDYYQWLSNVLLKKEGLGKGTLWWKRKLSLLQSGLRKLFNTEKNTKKTEATLEESAELLLQTMFPDSTRTTSHSKWVARVRLHSE